MPATSEAQLAGVGTASVVGTVRDDAGMPMRDVDVTISGRTLMPSLKTTTRADGEYRFVWLPPGDYVLTFASPGFDQVRRDAHLSLGSTLTINVPLLIAPRHEDVEVQGALDRHSVTLSQSFDARKLASIPSSRGLGGLFAVTPALMLGVTEVGGGTGIVTGGYGAYGRNSSPRHTLEGIVVTGLFGFGFTPDYGALEEVSILTAGHGAEWPSSGVHTDITTKSGSNQYRGTIYGAGEHRRLQSSNVDADQILRGAAFGGGLSPGQVNQLWRNTDVNADIGGFLRKDRAWWYASARHQVVAARLVKFPAEPYLTRLSNYSGKLTMGLSPGHKIVLYGQQGLNHQPYRLEPFAPPGGELSAGTVINETSESTVDQRNTSWLWKIEWTAVLSDSLLFEIRGGQFASDSDWTPRSAAPRFEDLDTATVKGGNRDSDSTARRNQFFATGSYFAENSSGRHFFRFGGEALRFLVRETWTSGYPGNVLHVMRSGRPTSVYVFHTPSLSEGGVWTFSGYVSDAWQMNRRLTVTMGIRFDRYRLFLPAQASPINVPEPTQFDAKPNLASWNVITPRFAGVFDVTGDGRTLAKLNYGKYGVAPNASTAFNSNPNTNPWWTQYEWLDPNQSGLWEPGEGVEKGRRGGEATESIDPGLKLPVVDEAGAWIEQTLPGGVTVRTGTVWRLERFQITRQNVRQLYKDFTVPVPILDRGPDGLAGTGDDGPTFTAYDLDPNFVGQPAENQVRNVPGTSSEFLTWEIAATRQTAGRWSFGAGFAHTWNKDHAQNYSGQSVRNNPYPLTPNDLINAGPGGRYEFTTWTAKAHGTVEGPWRLRVTPVLRHQSGQPFGRTQRTDRGQLRFGTVTILMEPIGTRRMDHITLLDLRLERVMRVRGGRLSAALDVFNVLNANPEQNAIWLSGSAFLRPLTIVPPRIARLGLTFDW